MVKCMWCIHKWGCGSNVPSVTEPLIIGGTGWCHNQDEIICNLLFHHSNLCSLSDTILFLCRHTNPHCPFTAICRDTYYPKLYLYSTLLHSCSLALCSSASSEHWSCMDRPNLLPTCSPVASGSAAVPRLCSMSASASELSTKDSKYEGRASSPAPWMSLSVTHTHN